MALFIPQNQQTPAQQAVAYLKANLTRSLLTLLQEFKVSTTLVWKNPRATPDQIMAELGIDAVKSFELSNDLVTFFNKWASEAGIDPIVKVVPDGWSYVLNQDGTVTVTQS